VPRYGESLAADVANMIFLTRVVALFVLFQQNFHSERFAARVTHVVALANVGQFVSLQVASQAEFTVTNVARVCPCMDQPVLF
jgi:hypothetical protein